MTSRLEQAGELLLDALDRAPELRAEFLMRACAGDDSLRFEVESLLAAHEIDGLLDKPIARFVAPAEAREISAGRVIGRYELRETVGAGGMGVVYRAWDATLGRTIALKFLPTHLGADDHARERFRIEAQAAAALDHPNICTIHEIGESDDGQLYIAMPFYEGATIRERLARGPLPVVEAVALACQAANGLAKAHERGIVHRDVKPANLMVTVDGVVKILDFGIAKLTDVTLTGPGVRPGTIAYMSVEQVRGESVDGRADIWSLGVVLYEMLTGARPFRGDSHAGVLHEILHAEPRWPALSEVGVPSSVERVIRRALAREAGNRYPTAAELARDLEIAVPSVTTTPRSVRSDVSPNVDRRGTRDESSIPAGERRQATIAACRLAGHARLLERLGSEAADRALREIHVAAESLATKYGGVLDRARGDTMTLVFGLPVAHEDDCLRATRSLLELQARVHGISARIDAAAGSALHLRAGIDMGTVIERPARVPGLAFEVSGPAVDTAAQLSTLAPPGEIWVSAECLRFIEGFVWTEARSPVTLGDREQPLFPYRVTGESGLQTSIEAKQRVRGLTPFTGRERELAFLLEQLEAAVSGAGRVVTVVGEAGQGKSRLLHEFRQRLDGRDVLQVQGRCPAHGGGGAYLPFIEVLRDILQLGGGDTGAVEGRSRDVVQRILALGAELEEFVPIYLHLLSIPNDEFPLPQRVRGEQFGVAVQEALAALVTVSARRRATVLLLEDWHWADGASRGALGQIADLTSEHALLVVLTTRPGRDEDWNAASHHALTLRSLQPDVSFALLRAVLRVAHVPPAVASLVHERTGGNPFFLEELSQTLVEEGILRVEDGAVVVAGALDGLHVPDTVQAVIRARLDRLPREAREVLRLASVVGREFTRRILEHTMADEGRLPHALEALKVVGLIQQTRIVPDAAYRFKHVLTQEVAYDGLLDHRRRELHGRVGAAIESLHGDRLEEHLARLAHHFSRAELWDRAVRYGVQAADRAGALAQYADAFDTLERARTWLAKLPDEPPRRAMLVDLLLRQERLCETLGQRERQQRIIDELVILLEATDDRANLAEVYVRQGDLFTLLRQFDAADAALDRSLRLRRELGDAVGVRNTLRSLGLLRWHEGRDREALEPVQEALAIDEALGDDVATVGDISNLGHVLKGIGEHERARAYLLQGLALSDRIIAETADGAVRGEVELKQCYLLHNLANVSREAGDVVGALAYLERAREIAGKRLPIQLSYHYTSLAHMHLQLGRIDEAVELYRAAVELTRQARFVPGFAQSLRMLGEVLLGLGRRADAIPHLQEAIGLFAQLKDRDGEARAWCRVASAFEQQGDETDAIAAWAKARALRRQSGDVAGEMEALEGLGRTTRQHLSEPSIALGYYKEAADLARTLMDAQTEGKLRNTIGILEWGRGEYREALSQYERALVIFRELHDEPALGLIVNSIGATLMKLNRPEAAREYLHEGLEIHRRARQPRLEGHALTLLGEIALGFDESREALSCFQSSLAIRRAIGDQRGEGWAHHHIARAQIARDRPDQAREALTLAERAGAACDDGELLASCRQLHRSAGL